MTFAEKLAEEIDGAPVTTSRVSRALAAIWEKASFWRSLAAALGVLVLALFVAALVARAPVDFSERPMIAVLHGPQQHPLWAIRLAAAAHQIAVDSLAPAPLPSGHVYQLWLVAPGEGTPRPLGLLPQSGRKVIAETPANSRLLSGRGDLIVTLEPKGGSRQSRPSGPVLLQSRLGGAT